MKQDEILGKDYLSTFGNILDYKLVAKYILNLNIVKNNIGLIDLACGTGLLLSEVRKQNCDIPLLGIDISKEQLSFLKKKHLDINYIEGDIFSFTLPKQFISQYWIAHLGFAFLNRATIYEIEKLFRNLYKLSNIKHIICEIWDYNYQMDNFSNNNWYKTPLNNGGYLLTKSSPLNKNGDKIKITFHFNINNKNITTDYIMYRHKTSAIKKCAIDNNWMKLSVQKATYRKKKDSHKILIISR